MPSNRVASSPLPCPLRLLSCLEPVQIGPDLPGERSLFAAFRNFNFAPQKQRSKPSASQCKPRPAVKLQACEASCQSPCFCPPGALGFSFHPRTSNRTCPSPFVQDLETGGVSIGWQCLVLWMSCWHRDRTRIDLIGVGRFFAVGFFPQRLPMERLPKLPTPLTSCLN